jgi:hypothetical protein
MPGFMPGIHGFFLQRQPGPLDELSRPVRHPAIFLDLVASF